jgi:HSP20 family protein
MRRAGGPDQYVSPTGSHIRGPIMNITRWEPFGGLDELFGRFGPMGFGRWPRVFEADGKPVEWTPTADISETDREYLVKAELPGVKRENVKVTVENGVLSIQGERKQEKEEKGEKQHRIERALVTLFLILCVLE